MAATVGQYAPEKPAVHRHDQQNPTLFFYNVIILA